MTEPSQFLDGRVTLMPGDCMEVVRTLADNSIDAVVTDPPYALVSIVKRFGADGAAPCKPGKTGAYQRASAGFMGKKWDTGETAFAIEFWAEILRVLKPGGHVAAFGGTRTFHRLACAIEDAGFEIRDCLMWHFGSGFPKSHDVSKGIDKAAGAEREIVGTKPTLHRGVASDHEYGFASAGDIAITAPATTAAKQWQGWGTALKPSTEIICLARKPLSERTVAANVLRWGTGAINVDACRVEGPVEADRLSAIGSGQGRASANVNGTAFGNGLGGVKAAPHASGRWPANLIHDNSPEVLAGFPESQSSRSIVTSKPGDIYGGGAGLPSHTGDYGFNDSGSAARFFYSAKADSNDRIGSKHPTVKPVDLMQWLCRLITPPGGVILDPFSGTGTTGEAAWREGFSAILVEREAEYQADIARRMDHALKSQRERKQTIAVAKGKVEAIGGLFG
jgi:DNA modification methylase